MSHIRVPGTVQGIGIFMTSLHCSGQKRNHLTTIAVPNGHSDIETVGSYCAYKCCSIHINESDALGSCPCGCKY